MDGDRWPFRVFGVMFAIFAVIALVLSSVGLYAVMAYSVTQRTSEIGLRMALGAQARQVRWMILKRGLVQLALGLTLGLAGALALSRVMERMLVGITPSDPVTFAVDHDSADDRVDRGVPAAGPPGHAGRSARRASRGMTTAGAYLRLLI